MKFLIKDIFSKCDQIRSFLRIWSRLLKKSLIENFIFCAVNIHDAVFNFKKSQAKKACNFIEKRLRYMCFPKNFADVLITPIS